MEIWKNIKGYEGLYKASSLGRIKSLKRKHVLCDKVLKQTPDNYGYLSVTLYKNNKSKKFLTHRIVGDCFINNINNYSDINHIDENNASKVYIDFCKRNNIVYKTESFL